MNAAENSTLPSVESVTEGIQDWEESTIFDPLPPATPLPTIEPPLPPNEEKKGNIKIEINWCLFGTWSTKLYVVYL